MATNWSKMAARAQMEQVKAGRIQPQGHEIQGRLVHNLCTDTIIHKTIFDNHYDVIFMCHKYNIGESTM